MRKTTLLLLTAACALSFAACGSGNASTGETAPAETVSTQTAAPAETETQTAAPAETETQDETDTEPSADAGQANSAETEGAYEDGSGLLAAVYASFTEEQKFPIGGGDSANLVMDAPGSFDVSKTDELDSTLGLPASEAGSIDDAASMLHMMNANTFTGAAYHLTDGTDAAAFAEAVKENILARQWVCGMPDTLVILHTQDGYVLTAFGAAELVENFKTAAQSVASGCELLLETPVTE